MSHVLGRETVLEIVIVLDMVTILAVMTIQGVVSVLSMVTVQGTVRSWILTILGMVTVLGIRTALRLVTFLEHALNFVVTDREIYILGGTTLQNCMRQVVSLFITVPVSIALRLLSVMLKT